MIPEDFIYFSLVLTQSSVERLENVILQDKIMQDIIQKKEVTKKYLHHCTVFHKEDKYPMNEQIRELLYNSIKKAFEEEVGKIWKIKVIGWGWNNKALALLVDKNSLELPICNGHKYHITVCTFDNGKPFESNNIAGWTLFKPIEVDCTLTETTIK